MIILICAVAKNGIIGTKGILPWHFNADLKNFKKLTMGNVLVLGRKTYESLPKILDGRKLIVLSKNRNYHTPRSIVVHSHHFILGNFLKSKDKCFIGGGGIIFELFIDFAEKIYLTEINKTFDGDAYFPLEKLNFFKEISCKEVVEKGVLLKFKILKRKN